MRYRRKRVFHAWASVLGAAAGDASDYFPGRYFAPRFFSIRYFG